jgi:hypothetical protein
MIYDLSHTIFKFQAGLSGAQIRPGAQGFKQTDKKRLRVNHKRARAAYLAGIIQNHRHYPGPCGDAYAKNTGLKILQLARSASRTLRKTHQGSAPGQDSPALLHKPLFVSIGGCADIFAHAHDWSEKKQFFEWPVSDNKT